MTTHDLFECHRGFFDLAFMRAQLKDGDTKSDAALIDEVLAPDCTRPVSPNAVFDVAYYRARQLDVLGESAGNPIVHYLTEGDRAGFAPHALVDPWFLRRNARRDAGDYPNLVTYMLANLGPQLPAFHPFVHMGFVCATEGRADRAQAVLDLLSGALSPERPHPLFDLAHLRRTSGQAVPDLRAAVRLYWDSDEDLATHPLFDVAHYQSHFQSETRISRSVYHYLTQPNPKSPNGLFDPAYYTGQVVGETGQAPARALEHYLRHGAASGLDPSPFFDAQYYVAQAGEGAGLEHYVTAGQDHFAPHPMIKLPELNMAAQAYGGDRLRVMAALARGSDSLARMVIPEFDQVYYRRIQKAKDVDAISVEYFRNGWHKNDAPSGALTTPYIVSQCRILGGDEQHPINTYFRQGWQDRRRVLIALDSLDDTETNRAWLRLCESQIGNPDVEMIVLGGCSGALSSAFFRVSHVWHLTKHGLSEDNGKGWRDSGTRLQEVLSANPPRVAFVEINDGPFLSDILAEFDVPVLSFGGAAMAQMPPEELHRVVDASAHVLCSSQSVMDAIGPYITEEAVTASAGFNARVGGGRVTEVDRYTTRSALELDPEDILILTSGGPDIQDGADIFGAFAAHCLRDADFAGRVRFIWHGIDIVHWNSPGFYAQHYVRMVGAEDRLEIVNTPDLAMLMAAADIYVKLPREAGDLSGVSLAQSMGVPVVAARNNPETEDILGSQARGLVYPFDLDGAREVCRGLIANPDLHRSWSPDAKTPAATDEDGGLQAFMTLVNDAIARVRPDLHLHAPEDRQVKRLMLVAPDDEALHDLLPVSAPQGAYTGPQVTWADLSEPVFANMGAAVCDAIARSGCAVAAVAHKSRDVTDAVLAQFDHTVWLSNGGVSEQSALYRLGLRFDDILVRSETLVEAMRALNPRIADKMQVIKEAEADG